MEENNYGESCSIEHKTEHHKSHFWKYLLTGLLTLLGAFLAFYVVADWHFKRMMDPALQMHRFEKAIMRQERQVQKAIKNDVNRINIAEKRTAQFVHVEKFDDVYKVIIDLTPFDNNEKNVEIKTEGNTLTINAAGEKTSRHKQEIVKYSQVFAFGENIDANGIVKVREGNNYIITVPFD